MKVQGGRDPLVILNPSRHWYVLYYIALVLNLAAITLRRVTLYASQVAFIIILSAT